MFADFKHKYFEEAFEKYNSPKDKLFLHDGDPSQNNRKANNAMYKVGVKNSVYQHGVLTMNSIENVFNYVRTKLHEEFFNGNITFENS